MATIATVLRLDKINKKGEVPIYFRIIQNRKIRYIASGVRMEEKYWDNKRDRVKPNHPNSKRLNSYLSNKFNELQEKVFEYSTEHKSFSTNDLKDHILGKKPTDFWEFANEFQKSIWAEGKIGTHSKNKSILQKLFSYMGGKPLSFQDLNVAFLMKYENHLRNELGNSTNTIHTNLKFIRKLFNDAIRYDLVDINRNPFTKYKLKTEKTQRLYLTEEELKLIEDYVAKPFSKVDLAKDTFIFSAYAGGVRISDVCKMQKINFDGTHFHFTIQKTKGQLSIKLPRKVLDIIEKWKSYSARFIFPFLPEDINLDDPVIVDRKISGLTALTNKNLKIIARRVGLKKPISFHVSRHTWATRALRKGISIDKVSKLMGHAQIREKQIYAKIVNEELDKAMDVFND